MVGIGIKSNPAYTGVTAKEHKPAADNFGTKSFDATKETRLLPSNIHVQGLQVEHWQVFHNGLQLTEELIIAIVLPQ
jgi:hypothetical protein